MVRRPSLETPSEPSFDCSLEECDQAWTMTNGFRELPSMEPVALGIVAVDELSSGSAVHKRVDVLHISCISGFKLNLQFEGG